MENKQIIKESIKCFTESNAWLSDAVIDVITEKYFNVKSYKRVIYLSPINIENALSKELNHVYDLEPLMLLRHLGITEDQYKKLMDERDSSIQVIMGVIHGPLTSEQRKSYGSPSKPNYLKRDINDHWSIFCYHKCTGNVYHYDSMGGYSELKSGYNELKFKEVIKFLRKYKILPVTIKCFSPSFYPIQKEGWECGYFTLFVIYIVMKKVVSLSSMEGTEITPISEKEIKVDYYSIINERPFYDMDSEFRISILKFLKGL